jgi:hypothetical protein
MPPQPRAFAPSESAPPLVPPANPVVVARPIFSIFDKDRDGTISRGEAAAAPDLARDFDRYDLNRDGRLDRDEFDRYAR